METSEGFEVSDYELFQKGAITSNHLRDSISSYKDRINQIKARLQDQTIIMGPAGDDIVEKTNKIDGDFENISDAYDKIAIRLTEIYEKYKKGDMEAAKRLIEACKTDSMGIVSASTSEITAPSTSAQNMIDRALSVLDSNYTGSGYWWTGDPKTSAFTCSGLVDYALGLPTNSNSPETLRDTIGVENLTTDPSKYKVGDLVFYEYFGSGHTTGWGHVGIYLGDGKVIDASTEAGSDNDGVKIRDVNWMKVLGVGTYPA